MKILRGILTAVVLLVGLLQNGRAYATGSGATGGFVGDSVRICLLTCDPGGEVYSLYGHTAIRYTDYRTNVDIAVNYGIFSFNKPYFIWRFIFGKTDYEMGIVPFDYFCDDYRREGRSVYEQELDLTADEKAAIAQAISVNFLPQNRTYRYNYLYDNCTTRARDILLDHVRGVVEYTGAKETYPSYRELIHSFNDAHPWARFGNDILLGVKADKKTDLEEHQFLPFELMRDFEKAVVTRGDGTARPLVSRSRYVVRCEPRAAGSGFPLSPSACAWVIFAVVAAVSAMEAWRKRKFWVFDTILLLFDGCLGVVVFTMFFSEHPTTSTNLQIFLLNPLPLFFVWRVARNAVKRRRERFWRYAAVSLALFFVGGFFQDYAEGTYVLALSLLLRCAWNIVYQNKYLPCK